jgi:hypothetical protein
VKFRRGAAPPPTVEAFVESIRARPRDPDPQRAATDAGLVEGLEERGPARLRPREDEEPRHFSGFLTGHLTSWLVERGQPLDNAVVRTASFYGGPVGDEHVQDMLDDPAGNVRKVHTYLMVYLEKKIGHPTDIAVESLLVSWLLTQLRLRPVDHAGRTFGRTRARRLARQFPDLAPEVPGD